MELDVYLKCILGVMLCFCQGLSSELECETNNVVQETDIESEECHDPLGTWPNQTSTCQLVSCKKNDSLTWKMLDPRIGKLQVQLRILPQSCNFTRYDVDLEVFTDENATAVDDTIACIANNEAWKVHSKKILLNQYCSDCRTDTRKCAQVYTITFKYVYVGWYRIKVTPYVQDGSTRQSQRSYRIHVNSTTTSYVKKLLGDLSVTATLQYRDNNDRELDVAFVFGPDLEFLDLDDSQVLMKLVGQVDPSKTHACYETGLEQACCAFQGGKGNASRLLCDMKEKLTRPVCRTRIDRIECVFYNMTQGNYCVIVKFFDDRCTQGTIWATDKTPNLCRWDIKKEYIVDQVKTDTDVSHSSSEIIYTSVALVLLFGFIVGAFLIRKRRNLVRERLANRPAETTTVQTYNFNNGHVNRFNFGQLLTLTDRPRPEVLLVYSRESPPFMELVACVRRVLDKICKCQVYDYFDPEMWNDVSQDPQGWVHALIVERQAKVVIIASEVGSKRHKTVLDDLPELSYKTPHAFDNLFIYALKILRDSMDENSYKNHFVVTFDGYTENSHLLEYFNPYTRFILPKHLNKLFEHLHDPESTMHFDTSRRLEERFEVRQLRLHLEHLINLKLLAQSDLETQKLYDW